MSISMKNMALLIGTSQAGLYYHPKHQRFFRFGDKGVIARRFFEYAIIAALCRYLCGKDGLRLR
jgi:hypothetical protein